MKIEQFHSNFVQNVYKNSEERKHGYVEGKTVGKSSVEISTEAKALVKRIRESEDSHFSAVLYRKAATAWIPKRLQRRF